MASGGNFFLIVPEEKYARLDGEFAARGFRKLSGTDGLKADLVLLARE